MQISKWLIQCRNNIALFNLIFDIFLYLPDGDFIDSTETWNLFELIYNTSISLFCLWLQKTIPQASFTVLVQSATFIRISYRHQYLIDITLCDGDRVLVRDGAYSLFDSQPVSYTNNYVSAQGLKVSGVSCYCKLALVQWSIIVPILVPVFRPQYSWYFDISWSAYRTL